MEVQVKTRKHTSWDYKHVVNNNIRTMINMQLNIENI
jgi:hypothetical protein